MLNILVDYVSDAQIGSVDPCPESMMIALLLGAADDVLLIEAAEVKKQILQCPTLEVCHF